MLYRQCSILSKETLVPVLLKYRRVLIVGLHIGFVVFSNFLAFWLRFGNDFGASRFLLWRETLPWLVLIRSLIFIPFRLYGGLWRYTSIWDLRNIILGIVCSSGIFALWLYEGLQLSHYPYSVLIIDSALLLCFMGGSRLGRRLYRDLGHLAPKKRVLVYGAGDAGEMIVRAMKSDPSYAYQPIGFVDDDPLKVGQRIHGVRVLGTRKELGHIFATKQPHEILVAIPSAQPGLIRSIVNTLERYKVPIKTLPNLRDILDGKVTVSQIRDLAVEDLLAREPIGLKAEAVQHLIQGKRVMVTGAGGSIGSELCRQIATLQPSALFLYERYENSLFAIGNDLARLDDNLSFHCIIGDITDTARVKAIFAEYQPEIIFHAAAHKHVPLMELNPCEAIKNNIFGTRILAEAAEQYGAERFILISTDKAVNPTSVMGTTKRAAELLIQSITPYSKTRFMVVRFGNVLGSNGSVVPYFLEQIKAGGPVTVTHPEVRRYFMLIPEAVHLVLHAAALGERGAIYVLEMGEQIRIVDMARNLIRLAGFVPDQEIPITFVGLRPGEKLYEELVGEDERAEPSGIDKIFRIRFEIPPDLESFAKRLSQLDDAVAGNTSKEILEKLRNLITTYHPGGVLNTVDTLES